MVGTIDAVETVDSQITITASFHDIANRPLTIRAIYPFEVAALDEKGAVFGAN